MSLEPTYVLGLSAFFHDSAAALLKDGEIIAAAQEERFTRIKHDSAFPKKAIEYCLSAGGISASDLCSVAYYEKPLLKFDRLISSYLHDAPRGLSSFLKAVPLWLDKKFFIEREIDQGLNNQYSGPIGFCTHHQSHAASAFFPSPFQEAAIITFDGVGEWSSTTWGEGKNNKIDLHHEIQFPHSLGLLYSAFTYFTGFRVNSGEYKLMGLAPYGEPKHYRKIVDNIIEIKDDGSFRLNLEYFNYVSGLQMTSTKMNQLFGRPPRASESPITQDDMDIAASIQKVTEEIMLKISSHVKQQTGHKYLCLAGGVALNCVGNGKIIKEKIFENIWIQPAAGDAGGALGAALFDWHQVKDNKRQLTSGQDLQKGSLLGPSYTNEFIKDYLDSANANYDYFEDSELFDFIATEISSGKVVGFVQGRMEFGPRALGSRSILGDARSPKIQELMNLKIKFRESFRPFAPSCLEEDVTDFFELNSPSPYMLIVAPVKESRRISPSKEQVDLLGLAKLKMNRSDLPAITHVDGSARVQTVSEANHPRYHKLLKSVKKISREGIVVNTSFNIRGEPIVMSPSDAYRCFMYTEMDILVMENYVCLKEKQPQWESAENYKQQFKLD